MKIKKNKRIPSKNSGQQSISFARLLKTVTVILGIIITVLILYDRTKNPVLEAQLMLEISGFELILFNKGNAVAEEINVDVVAWQYGSPGVELHNSFPIRDLGTRSEYTIYEVFEGSLFNRSQRAPVSGYITVSCISCNSQRVWAFYIPDPDSQWPPINEWPIIEIQGLENKPSIGSCVDYPKGVCNGTANYT